MLTRKHAATFIISSIIIGLFAGVGGSYFLQNNFWAWVIAVLGIAGILLCLGGAGRPLLIWSKVERARSTSVKQNVPRIPFEWHYRPRKAIRSYSIVESTRAETSQALSPDPFAMTNNGSCNDDSLERTANTFVNLDPTIEDETAEARLLGRACAVSTYD